MLEGILLSDFGAVKADGNHEDGENTAEEEPREFYPLESSECDDKDQWDISTPGPDPREARKNSDS